MFSKNTFFLALMLICNLTTEAQKEIPLFTPSNKKSTRPMGSGGVTGAELKVMKEVPYDVYKTVDNGIVILAGDELYKYNSDFQLVFKSDLSNLFKFSKLHANVSVVSDDKATYVLEVMKYLKEKVSVIHINPKGEPKQQSYEIGINENTDYSSFILNGKLCVLGKNVDKKTDKVVYKYYYISPADDKLTSRVVPLPADDYEYEKIKKEMSYRHFWRYLGVRGENVILVKSYFRKVEGSKKYSFVCELAEVDKEGNMQNNRSVAFEPRLAGDDREFFSPTLVFDNSDESIYFTGFMEIDRGKINGLFLLKYDYNTASLIYNKEYAFTELMKPEIKKNTQVHYEIPERVGDFYPLNIRENDILLDKQNKFISLRIITDYGSNNMTFFEVSFDKYGDHIKTVVTYYPTYINYYHNYVVNPTGYQLVWADKTRPHVTSAKPGPWDYIYSQTKEKKSDLLWIPISTPQGNSVLKYNSEEKKFSAIMLQ